MSEEQASLFPPVEKLDAVQTIYGFICRDLDGLENVGLVELADYVTALCGRAKAMRSTWKDGDFAVSEEKFREELDDLLMYQVRVSALLAKRTAWEYPNA